MGVKAFSFYSVGAVTEEERARWEGYWLHFCKQLKHQPTNKVFYDAEDIGRLWAVRQERLLSQGFGGIGLGPKYFKDIAERFIKKMDQATEYAFNEEAKKARQENKQESSYQTWQRTHTVNSKKIQMLNVLGLSFGSTGLQIKEAYRKLVKKHHPDAGGSSEVFMKIHEAYKYLKEIA